MPVTITPVIPGTRIGWGLPIGVQSDFIGPIQPGGFWFIDLNTDPEFGSLQQTWRAPATNQTQTFVFGQQPILLSNFDPTVAYQTNTNVEVRARLTSPTGSQLDVGQLAVQWDNDAGRHADLVNQINALSGHGLTTAQATLLQQAHDNSQVQITTPTGVQTFGLGQLFSQPLLDTFTLTEITHGPQPGFASMDLPNNAAGVIVRVTSLGAGYAAMSPDDGWFRPELAVANFFRGTDLVARIGVHTVSRFIYPLPGAWPEWTSLLFGGTLPPQYSVQVTFAAGNEGQVFFTALP